MTIESKIDRTNELLIKLIGKFDHIDQAMATVTTQLDALPETEVAPPEAESLADVAEKSTSKRRPRRTKAQMEADKVEKAAEDESTEEEESELPPEPKEVKSAQDFKKEVVAIGRASGDASYVSVIKGVLADAGFVKAEDVPAASYDAVLKSMDEAFTDEDV